MMLVDFSGKEGMKGAVQRDFSKMSVKVLKKFLRDAGSECRGCSDKQEFVAKAEEILADAMVGSKDDL
eukprot:SAG31_NODE_1591_length_7814_cov_4.501453_9_plen_68_part_00